MKPIDPIERILEEAPLPRVVAGTHQDQLKLRLLAEAQSAQPGRKRMRLFADRNLAWKGAALVGAAVLLIGAGWASEKIYKKFFKTVAVNLEKTVGEEVKLPNGAVMGTMTGVFTTIDADDPKGLETAKRRHEEMKRLIARREYEFLRDFEIDGRKQYVYSFRFSDGSRDRMNFSMPLDQVASWDDYQRKSAEEEKLRTEQIGKAMAAGRFRLIDGDATLIHVGREAATGRKYRIQRLAIPDSSEKGRYLHLALYHPFESDGQEVESMPQTGWNEYLDAVRDGKWEILSTDTMPTYRYEVVLDDGTRTVFRYGGKEPLKKPEPDGKARAN